jgi:putative CocE/NonD family hydrolase
VDTPLLEEPRVRYFVMGENAWREASSWPPEHTHVNYYLHSGGRANSRMGDGALATEPPATEPPDSFVYDPLDPVPTAGGRTLLMVPGGVQNQAKIEERDDVLVYSSHRLVTPVTIAGPVSVTLFASSSAPDTDFTAKLVDVEPDGYCANLAEGIIRARYRNGRDREDMLEPGAVTEFVIDPWDVAHTFRSSHRIRLEISSSNFPHFDRNLNSRVDPAAGTAAEVRKAVQQVSHTAKHPSHVTLPVVPGS